MSWPIIELHEKLLNSMKTIIVLMTVILLTVQVLAQGTFLLSNGSAPTRLYDIDGPFAGPGILGQMLAGPAPESLSPVGMPLDHLSDGWIFSPGIVVVPGVPCLETAYFQFVAWDGRVWGSDSSLVPDNQIGRTDVVPLTLSGAGDPNCSGFPTSAPYFTRPAVVPAVPEPSTWVLLALGVFWILRLRIGRGKRMESHPHI